MIPQRRSFRVIAGLVAVTALSAAITVPCTANATPFLWSAASPGLNNWNNDANWTPNTGNPGASDTAVFSPIGTTSQGSIDNIVSVNTTVTGLTFTNFSSGTWHVTQIPTNVTLAVTGNMVVGGISNFVNSGVADGSFNTTVQMLDAGTLVVHGNLTVGDGGTNGPSSGNMLDLSGLTNFVYTNITGTFALGFGTRSGANMKLAAVSNYITAGNMNLNSGSSSSSASGTFTLGSGTNIINANNFNAGGQRANCTVTFPGPGSGGLRLRGTNGTDADRAAMTLAFRQASGSGGTTTGTLSLNGDPVDMKIGTLIAGWSTNVSGNVANGTINFDTGTIDATNIILGTTRSAGCTATGTINVGANGQLLIGAGGLTLGNLVAGTTATGNLTVNGGSVVASGNIVKGSATGVGNINFSSGTLTIGSITIGTATVPIDNLTLSSATVHLNVNGTATGANINANSLSAGGTTITIDSVANVAAPVVLHLISYNVASGDQFSGFTLGTLPAGYSGTLIDNSGSIDLSIGPAGITVTPLLWVGAVGSSLNSSWDLSTMNWLDTNGNAVAYSNPDFVHFDDTARNPVVTLTTTNLTPSVLTFTNQGAASGGLDYTLNGPGAIEGTVSFFKDGLGLVTRTESGGDNFSGGVTVNNGTVILDDANSAITGGFTINNSATLQIGNNDANGNVPPGDALNNGALIVNQSSNEQVTNPIPGFGSLTKLGNGTLTLTGTNGYSGNTFVFGGTLALSGAGTISNSASVVFSNATLDVTGVIGKTLVNSLTTSNSTLNLAVPATLAIPMNVVNGSWTMGGSTNMVNISTLPPIASYPTTLTIAQCPGGINGFNLGLGTLPAGSPSFEGNVTLSSDNTTVFLTLTSGPTSVRASVLWVGTNNVTTTTNWSDNLNWQLPGAPTPADNVVFAQNGSVSGTPFNSVGDGHDGIGNPTLLNNIVDTNLSVGTLLYTNIGGVSFSQNTFITNGAMLNIVSNGSLTIGNRTLDFGPGATEFVTIAGTNGTLNINNTNGTTYVGLGDATNGTELATLDLSGLGTLNASVSRFLVGVGSGTEGISISRSAGVVYLAQTNIITAYLASGGTETSDTAANTITFNIGEDDGNAGLPSALYLGQTNAIMADAVGTGREKSGAAIAFNPNLLTANTRPTAYFRGANAAAVTTWSIGDQVANSGSGENANGTNDFTGGHVDALVSTLFVGRASSSATSSGTSTGTLTFDDGIFNVTTAFIGFQPTNSAKVTTGTVNVKTNSTSGTFATLLVSSNLSLGVTTTGGTAATGNLNIDGGTVEAGTILCGGNNSITVGASGFGGVLAVNNTLGASGASLNALNLAGNTILSLPASNSAPAVVNTLTIDGQATTTNVLNISSVQGTVTPSMELPVIQYTTLNNSGGSFNMGLGTLPAGYSGFFTNDTTHSTIGVVITSVPVSGPSTNANITHVSLSGTNLVVQGTNNNVPNTNFQYEVLVSTNVALPLSNWTIVTTNAFNPDGTFDYTNPIVPGTSRQFIDVKVVP